VHQLNDEVRRSPALGDVVVLNWASQHSYVVGNGGGASEGAPEDDGEPAVEREEV
jgi:hypothetical protein